MEIEALKQHMSVTPIKALRSCQNSNLRQGSVRNGIDQNTMSFSYKHNYSLSVDLINK